VCPATAESFHTRYSVIAHFQGDDEQKDVIYSASDADFYVDHPVRIPVTEKDCMKSEHEQLIRAWSKAREPTYGHYTDISGVTANHRTPADIAVILSGESRR
jgi:hypothetical protein